MADVTILFQEGRRVDDDFTDTVFVCLRRWDVEGSRLAEHWRCISSDYVLETEVGMDGEICAKSLQAYPGHIHQDHDLIRRAIQTYDQLCETHPNRKYLNRFFRNRDDADGDGPDNQQEGMSADPARTFTYCTEDGALVCDQDIPGITIPLAEKSVNYRGGKFFVCESISIAAAQFLAEQLGGVLVEG